MRCFGHNDGDCEIVFLISFRRFWDFLDWRPQTLRLAGQELGGAPRHRPPRQQVFGAVAATPNIVYHTGFRPD